MPAERKSYIDGLTLSELETMHAEIGLLVEVGKQMVRADCDPIFDLAPGRTVRIRVEGVKLPPVSPGCSLAEAMELRRIHLDPEREKFVAEGIETLLSIAMLKPDLDAGGDEAETGFSQPEAAPAQPEPEHSDPAAENGPADPQPMEASPNEAGPVDTPAAVKSVAGVSVSQERFRPWTDVDDDLAIRLRAGDKSFGAIGEALGRSEGAVRQRLNGALRDRMTEALKSAKPDAGSVGEGITLEAYLRALPRKNGWSLERDADLIRLASLSWKIPEVAEELGVDAGAVKKRWDLLLCGRRFSIAEVSAALDADASAGDLGMSGRQSYSLEEIKDMLVAQIDQVAVHYAPEASGSYIAQGRYFTLNPGRVDRSVGSFWVNLSGPRVGCWEDRATGDFGDVLDLIKLSLSCSLSDAIREARAYLGLQHDSPEDRRRREDAAAAARSRRKEAEAQQRDRAERVRNQCHAIYLSAAERIASTPVESYLRDTRGLDLSRLGRQPRALRYLDKCWYKSERIDPETGEVLEQIQGKMPAMVALIVDGNGRPLALHRTYLELKPNGQWGKASIADPKKVLGKFAGGAIRLWSGAGPRGGKGSPLSECLPGTRVYIAEGIETSLSIAVLKPDVRVLAAVSLANMANIQLPRNVSEVVLVADADDAPEARAQLDRAITAHAERGRTVRIWQSGRSGEDLNDALKRALAGKGAA